MVKAKNVHKEGNYNYFLLWIFFLYSFEISIQKVIPSLFDIPSGF